MKEKKWIFFRVMVYLCLAAAGFGLSMLFYFYFLSFRGLRRMETISLLCLISLSLQIVFNTLNVRLIHHHLFNKLLPPPAFSIWHTVLLVLNSCIAIALISLFLYGFLETFKTTSYRKSINTEDIIALVLIGSYTFITICTITGSLILRRYIKYYTSIQEEEWLNQIGS